VISRDRSYTILCCLLPLLAMLILGCQQSNVLIVRVIDGDTIVTDEGVRIRYIGVDTPELGRGGKIDEPFAVEAKQFNRQLVEGRKVRLVFDKQMKDRFGRTLAYVYVGETMVNEALVERGLARAAAYPPDTRHRGDFERLQREAEAKGLGIWGR